jgi:hypothetical protein
MSVVADPALAVSALILADEVGSIAVDRVDRPASF